MNHLSAPRRRARFAVALLLGAISVGCDDPAPPPAPPRPAPAVDPAPGPPDLAGLEPWSDAWIQTHAESYLEDPRERRRGLEESLTNHENLYSRTRLGAYGRPPGGWDSLPVWNPRVAPLTRARAAALETGAAPEIGDEAAPIWSGRAPDTVEGWRALGERVFFELPLRSEPFWEVALRDPALGEELGVERAPDGSVPGLVAFTDVDGAPRVGITCALCHSARGSDGGAIVAGRARRRLDYGRVRILYYDAHDEPIEPDVRRRWQSWGPGRADVLEDVADTPIAITDLYGLRRQRLLTQAGTLRHQSPLAVAIRQETQYIQANHHHTRPPRELMWALTTYLYALEAAPVAATDASPETLARGEALFGRQCARCHENAVRSGDTLVPIDDVGTHPQLATGGARGTGGYRPAPLVRVAEAAPYLHNGAVPDLASLLGEARFRADYTGGPDGPGPVQGHRFGVALDPPNRDALIAYLATL